VSKAKDADVYDLDLLTSYYSVDDGQNIGNVLQEVIYSLRADMDNKLLKAFKDHNFHIDFTTPAGGVSIGMETGKADAATKEKNVRDQAVAILSDIIVKMQATPGGKRGILIIIDEVHNLKENLKASASLLRSIVTTLDVNNLGHVAFLLAGYEDSVGIFFSEDTSARRVFDVVKLDVMPDHEAFEVWKKGFEKSQIRYDETFLRENIRVARGYPYHIQKIGHHLVKADTDNNVDQEDWNNAIESVLGDFNTQHPEAREGEIWIANVPENRFGAVKWDTKRLGTIAYNNKGEPVSGHRPVFAEKKELEKVGHPVLSYRIKTQAGSEDAARERIGKYEKQISSQG